MILEFFSPYWEVIVSLLLGYLFYRILKNEKKIIDNNNEILDLLEKITKDVDLNFKEMFECIKN